MYPLSPGHTDSASCGIIKLYVCNSNLVESAAGSTSKAEFEALNKTFPAASFKHEIAIFSNLLLYHL